MHFICRLHQVLCVSSHDAVYTYLLFYADYAQLWKIHSKYMQSLWHTFMKKNAKYMQNMQNISDRIHVSVFVTSKGKSERGKTRLLAVTGIAPWLSNISKGKSKRGKTRLLAVTGIAPWLSNITVTDQHHYDCFGCLNLPFSTGYSANDNSKFISQLVHLIHLMINRTRICVLLQNFS